MNASVPTPARLAVVVCTYNRSASLVDTLGSLWADGYAGPAPIDVLVVANRCTDDTLARLGEFERRHSQDRLRLRWIEEPQPGKSHALNAAIAYTHHDALCFVDDDQIAEPGFFAALIRGLGDFPDDDMFCGRIWPAWDGSEPSCGGNITVRRRVFDRVGGFSVALGPTGHNLAGGEDHEFLQRAVDAGFHIRYLPEVRQLHAIDAERTRASYILKKSYLRSRSSFLVDPPVSGPRMYMLRKIISHGLRAAAALDADRRFYLMVRTAASVGELMGAVEAGRRARTMGQANISSP